MKIKFKNIIILLLILKLFILPLGAHPFDFWAFVNGFQKYFIYDIGLFEHWNKGNLYHILVLPFFGLYSVILDFFNIQGDNMFLLHFFMKLPFLFLDIIIAYNIFKIISEYTKNIKYGQIGAVFWLANPFVYFVYGIHGHYELLTVVGLSTLILGLLRKNIFFSMLGFSIAFVMKYWVIVLGPFILMYFLTKKYPIKNIITGFLFLGIFVVLSFIHMFFDQNIFMQTFGSILDLSKTNAPSHVTNLKIPSYNIFSFFYFIFNGELISENKNPVLFLVASKGLILSGICILMLLTYRLIKVIKSKIYLFKDILKDIVGATILLFIFSSNFQTHYLIYFIFLYLILVFISNGKLLLLLVGLTVIGFLNGLRGELGPRTYFLDLGTNIQIPFLLPQLSIDGLEGCIIIILIVISFSYLKVNQKINQQDYNIYIGFIIFCWVIILLTITQVLSKIQYGNIPNKLAYAGEQIPRGYTAGLYELITSTTNDKTYNISNYSGTPILSYLKDSNYDLINSYFITQNRVDITKVNHCYYINNYAEIKQYRNIDYYFYKINLDCIYKENNTITFSDNYNSVGKVGLLFETKELNINYLENKRMEIQILSLISIIYLLGFFYLGIIIFNKIFWYKET